MLNNIRTKMNEYGIDTIILTNVENEKAAMNLYYATGFTGSSGCALIGSDFAYFITDFRYKNVVDTQVSDEFTKVIQSPGEGLFVTLANIAEQEGLKKVYHDPYMYSFEMDSIKEKSGLELETFKELLNECRNVKTETELEHIRQACKITDEAYDYVLKTAKPGMTEKEMALLVERKMVDLGAISPSFNTIFASGENGANPHAVPSDKVLKSGELVTLDFGCYYNRYASDMTRTFAIGELDEKLEEIYNVVMEAQRLGVEAVKAGVLASDVDKACRDYIIEAGYGEYFGHGTGHGLGLDVHEAISVYSKSTAVLEVGNVITIEPGIYIPGLGGVRIEDDVVVTKDGCEILNSSPKELIKL